MALCFLFFEDIHNRRPNRKRLLNSTARLVAQIDRLEKLKIRLEFNRTAAQIDEVVKDGEVSLNNIPVISAEAQRIAVDLDLHRRGRL